MMQNVVNTTILWRLNTIPTVRRLPTHPTTQATVLEPRISAMNVPHPVHTELGLGNHLHGILLVLMETRRLPATTLHTPDEQGSLPISVAVLSVI